MARLTIEVPDALTTELSQYGISEEEIHVLVVQFMQMLFHTGQQHLSQEAIRQWFEALDTHTYGRDGALTEQAHTDTYGASLRKRN